MFKRHFLRSLRFLALVMMGVAAVFGIPVIPPPPPANLIVHVAKKGGRPRGRGRRRS